MTPIIFLYIFEFFLCQALYIREVNAICFKRSEVIEFFLKINTLAGTFLKNRRALYFLIIKLRLCLCLHIGYLLAKRPSIFIVTSPYCDASLIVFSKVNSLEDNLHI